jgi:hypothetical protein
MLTSYPSNLARRSRDSDTHSISTGHWTSALLRAKKPLPAGLEILVLLAMAGGGLAADQG